MATGLPVVGVPAFEVVMVMESAPSKVIQATKKLYTKSPAFGIPNIRRMERLPSETQKIRLNQGYSTHVSDTKTFHRQEHRPKKVTHSCKSTRSIPNSLRTHGPRSLPATLPERENSSPPITGMTGTPHTQRRQPFRWRTPLPGGRCQRGGARSMARGSTIGRLPPESPKTTEPPGTGTCQGGHQSVTLDGLRAGFPRGLSPSG